MCFNGDWYRLCARMSQTLSLFSTDIVMYVTAVHSIFFGQGKHCGALPQGASDSAVSGLLFFLQRKCISYDISVLN